MSTRSQPLLLSVFLLLLGVAVIPMLPFIGLKNNSKPAISAKVLQKSSVQKNSLAGSWYMGTMMGVDCNLKITPNVLTVQFGGCFQQDKPITTPWKLQGDKLMFQSSALNGSLGKYLRIARYRNHFVLFPERSKIISGKENYSYTRCFWRNTLKNGLQLSKDAPQ